MADTDTKTPTDAPTDTTKETPVDAPNDQETPVEDPASASTYTPQQTGRTPYTTRFGFPRRDGSSVHATNKEAANNLDPAEKVA